DNGRGFLADSDHTGFGLISMSDRADRIGGQLTINSQPGQGTEIRVNVFLEERGRGKGGTGSLKGDG
ncbi:MAG: hypothetical protein KME27_19910, partial [Lyngbya sp. HA4199-MV5]|nr:hypothetical protein [Lyngbya sp. HA4199-MV5]